MICLAKNKECTNATPFGGCYSTECVEESIIQKPTAKQRVETELAELSAKLDKLNIFIKSDTFQNLIPEVKYDLIEQSAVMTAYQCILKRRLAKAKN